MKKLVMFLSTLSFIFYLLSCERNDMYTISKFEPGPEVVYIFTDTVFYTGDFSPYSSPQELCTSVLASNFSSLKVTHVEPLLSTYERGVRDIIPDAYGNVPVLGVKTGYIYTQISSSWSGLWDGSIDESMNTATDAVLMEYWTGSNVDGTLSANNCSNWTSSSGLVDGQKGGPAATNSGWLSIGFSTCSTGLQVMCAAY